MKLYLICIFLINLLFSQQIKLINIKQLTFEGDNGEAYFSIDNSKLVFQSKRDGNECDKIYEYDLKTNTVIPLSVNQGAFTCGYYGLDNEIFFSSTIEMGSDCPAVYKHPNPHKYIWPLRPFHIYSWNKKNGIKKLSFIDGYNAETTVHPFENKIIFTSLQNGDIDLFEMDYNGKNIKQITNDFGYDGGAFYSPDGKKIVWRAWYPENEEQKQKWKMNLKNKYIEAVPLDIYIADRDGKNKKRLTNNGATNWAPSWHPDGKHIIFSSNMDDWNEKYNSYGHNFELYFINIDNLKLDRITENDTFDSFPMFSSNGKKLVFCSNRGSKNARQTNVFISDFISLNNKNN